jgi:hypothetical protein
MARHVDHDSTRFYQLNSLFGPVIQINNSTVVEMGGLVQKQWSREAGRYGLSLGRDFSGSGSLIHPLLENERLLLVSPPLMALPWSCQPIRNGSEWLDKRMKLFEPFLRFYGVGDGL